jgi:hypothetical protein
MSLFHWHVTKKSSETLESLPYKSIHSKHKSQYLCTSIGSKNMKRSKALWQSEVLQGTWQKCFSGNLMRTHCELGENTWRTTNIQLCEGWRTMVSEEKVPEFTSSIQLVASPNARQRAKKFGIFVCFLWELVTVEGRERLEKETPKTSLPGHRVVIN